MSSKKVVVAALAVVLMSAPTFAQQTPAPGSKPQQQAPAPAPAKPDQAQQQAPAKPDQAPAQKAEVAMGELVRVDTTAKTISVRPEKGEAMTFTYNDATKVTGAGDVAGLATMSGSRVTVHYAKQGQSNLASQIEVQKKAS